MKENAIEDILDFWALPLLKDLWIYDMIIILLFDFMCIVLRIIMNTFLKPFCMFLIWFENIKSITVAVLYHCICCESWMSSLMTEVLCEYNPSVNIKFPVCSITSHIYHHLVLLHCAAFNLRCLCSGVWHLCSICLHYVLCLSSLPSSTPSICVFPLALAPILVQIHRAASVRRPSDPSKACSSTSPSHSAPNPLASPCRPSKTGEHLDKSRTEVLTALNRMDCSSFICSFTPNIMLFRHSCAFTGLTSPFHWRATFSFLKAFHTHLSLVIWNPPLFVVQFFQPHQMQSHRWDDRLCFYLIFFSSVFRVSLRRQPRRSTPSRWTLSSGNDLTSKRAHRPTLHLHTQRRWTTSKWTWNRFPWEQILLHELKTSIFLSIIKKHWIQFVATEFMMKCRTQRLTCKSFEQQQSKLCKYGIYYFFKNICQSFSPVLIVWTECIFTLFSKLQLPDPRSFGATGSSLLERNSAGVAASVGANTRSWGAWVRCCKGGWCRRGEMGERLSQPLLRATGGVFQHIRRTNRKHHRGWEERGISWARRKKGPMSLCWQGARIFKREPSRASSSGVSQTRTVWSPG